MKWIKSYKLYERLYKKVEDYIEDYKQIFYDLEDIGFKVKIEKEEISEKQLRTSKVLGIKEYPISITIYKTNREGYEEYTFEEVSDAILNLVNFLKSRRKA